MSVIPYSHPLHVLLPNFCPFENNYSWKLGNKIKKAELVPCTGGGGYKVEIGGVYEFLNSISLYDIGVFMRFNPKHPF